MSEFDLSKLPGLLARLDSGIPTKLNIFRGVPNVSANYVDRDTDSADRAGAAAAIRVLMERLETQGIRLAMQEINRRNDAVAAEREACARVCRDRADFNLREAKSTGRTMFVDRYQESLECEAAIRARGDA